MIDKLSFLSSVIGRWVPARLATLAHGQPQPTHVMFCICDHYEPGTGGAPLEHERKRLDTLLTRWPLLAERHVDSHRVHPTITWFFPPHYHRHGNLRALVSLCERGYGEIELHLHHGKSAPDTAEHLAHTIRLCVNDYARFGIFGTERGEKRYAFIHGDWALANSRHGGKMCGVNDELRVLKETGCYADFTFPSCNESNPSMINAIYYARCDSPKPRAHRKGIAARTGTPPPDGLLMIQGPLHPIFVDGHIWRLRAFGDDVAIGKPPTRNRIDQWVKTWIHVDGRRDWVFVKVHTHGAVDSDVLLGRDMDEAFEYLEQRYNDGRNYVLHYVTAREMYNIVQAAEAGETGDPDHYRNYRIVPPQYDSSLEVFEASTELREAVFRTYPA